MNISMYIYLYLYICIIYIYMYYIYIYVIYIYMYYIYIYVLHIYIYIFSKFPTTYHISCIFAEMMAARRDGSSATFCVLVIFVISRRSDRVWQPWPWTSRFLPLFPFLLTWQQNTYCTCPHCSCFLGEWTFYNIPKLFRARPFCLPNSMMVYKTKFCYTHTSIWYFRRGKRKYASFTGAKRLHIHKQLVLAGAPIGLPGDRGSLFKYFALTSQTHLTLYDQVVTDPAVRQRVVTINVFARRMLWRNVTLLLTSDDAKINCNTDNTLPLPLTGESSPFLVQSALCLRRKIVITPKDDTIIATFDKFSLPKGKLLFYSWNVETFIGVGKYEQFQSIVKNFAARFLLSPGN